MSRTVQPSIRETAFIPAKLLKSLPGPGAEFAEPMLSKIQWLVFSDTILLTLSLKDIVDQSELQAFWTVFLYEATLLYSHMFQFGLPLRGAITEGSFVVEQSCFAGKAIIEAFKVAEDLNMAGVVITPGAIKWAEINAVDSIKNNPFFCRYLVPYKTRGEIVDAMLNVAVPLPGEATNYLDGDIRQIVHECFWKHGKDIPISVTEKIENTEKFIRFLKTKYPEGFKIYPKL